MLAGGMAANAATSPAEVQDGASTSVSATAAASIKPARLDGFDPGRLIEDSLFYDGAAMSAAQIQAFLDQKIGSCTNGQCINVLAASFSSRGTIVSGRTGNVVCTPLTGGTMPVSEAIYRVQVSCGISAKVILVTLEKEQGLATSRAPSDRNLRFAMGANCPDTAPCDPAFAGIGPQLVAGVTQLKTYKAGAFARQPGNHFIQYNPNEACSGTNLFVSNYATAALYNYTPYQPNPAALRAGYGLGDGCSSYGNRNFYNYYTDWFGAATNLNPNGPFGVLEAVEAIPGGFRVSGWTIDPDSAASVDVHIYVGGVGRAFTADLVRSDVGAAYPQFGSRHGYSFVVPVTTAGPNDVCVYAINIGAGGNSQIGCATKLGIAGSPVGSVEGVTAVEGGVTVSGWALDPDTTGAIDVHIYIGTVGYAVSANRPRSDVASVYPGYSGSKGFGETFRAPAGRQTVCSYAINVGVGANVQLGCVDVVVPAAVDSGRVPLGQLEGVTMSDTTVTVSGWTIDPDTIWPIQVRIEGAGRSATVTADRNRSDVAASYPGYGVQHGFLGSLVLPPGRTDVCVYGVNTGGGGDALLGCRSVTATLPDLGRAPIGVIDAVTVRGNTAFVSGWALDQDNVDAVPIHIYAGSRSAAYTADKSRPDIGAAFPVQGPNHGFSESIAIPAGSTNICVYAINLGRGANSLIGCRQVTAVDNSRPPIGNLESATGVAGGVAVGGWAFDPDTAEPIAVHVYVDQSGTALTADVPRSDVAAAYGRSSARLGFGGTVAASPGPHRVCAYAINDGPYVNAFLGCRDLTVP